jgi:calcineurin-like phosphoesterase family protein
VIRRIHLFAAFVSFAIYLNTKSSVKRYDVGVDANNYTPVSYLELKEWFKTDK